MAAPVYATVDDLAAAPWSLDPAPASAERLLATASRLVRRATMLARYPVTDDGLPRDADLADALRDATCAQVVAWAATSVDPGTGGYQPAPAAVQSRRIGSAALTYDTSAAASVTALNARAAAATSLVDDALQILADAGLTGHRPGTYR